MVVPSKFPNSKSKQNHQRFVIVIRSVITPSHTSDTVDKMEPVAGLEEMEQSVDILQCSTDAFLWRDVCQASAWLDRAHKLLDKNSIKNDPKTVIDCAEKALLLYQGCFAKVKKRASLTSTTATVIEPRSHDPLHRSHD